MSAPSHELPGLIAALEALLGRLRAASGGFGVRVSAEPEFLRAFRATNDSPPDCAAAEAATGALVAGLRGERIVGQSPIADGLWVGDARGGAPYALELRFDRCGSSRVSGDLFRRRRVGPVWCLGFATIPTAPILVGAYRFPVLLTTSRETRLAAASGTGELGLVVLGEDRIGATLQLEPVLPEVPTGVVLAFELLRRGPHLRRFRAGEVTVSGEARAGSGLARKLEAAGLALEVEPVTEARLAATKAPLPETTFLAFAEQVAHEGGCDLLLATATGATRRALRTSWFPSHEALELPVIATFGDYGIGDDPLRGPLRAVGELLGLDPTATVLRRSAVAPAFFDPDELAFLRHAPLPLLGQIGLAAAVGRSVQRPGSFDAMRVAAPYGGVPYIEEWPGCPKLPDDAGEHSLVLEIELPRKGATLALGQPLFLTLRLVNRGTSEMEVDLAWLDVKTGALRVGVRRVGWSRTQIFVRPFRPTVRRAYASTPRKLTVRAPLLQNLQIGYGLDGPIFAEPGRYEIRLALHIPHRGEPLVVEAMPVTVRVSEPTGPAENEEALRLLTPRAGFWLALGGAPHLDETGRMLEAIADERAARGTEDGVVATVWRAAALDRRRTRPGIGRAAAETAGEEAEALVGKLDPGLLDWFDPLTAKVTRRLPHSRKKGRRTIGAKIRG